MKKAVFVVFCCAVSFNLHAQRCLDVNILSLMGTVQMPGGASSCLAACAVAKNDDGQEYIVNYGTNDMQVDETIKKNSMEFTQAFVYGAGAVSSQMHSAGQVQDAKALAAKLQGMTPDQQKAYIMQMAQQMQANRQSPGMADNPQNVKLAMQTQSIVTTQLKPLGDELAQKYRDLLNEEKRERDGVKMPNYNSCPPVDKTGMPGCPCVNKLDLSYWQKIVAIEDRYNTQKTALLQSYLPRYKSLIGQVEDNISKLKFGDAVNTPMYKKILFSAQSSAFAQAFDIPVSIIKSIRKTGSDAYVNKVNCDNNVYNLSCYK